MAKTDELSRDSVTAQHAAPPVRGRATIQASDRRLELSSHDTGEAGGEVVTFHIHLQDTISLQFSVTGQELADALETVGVSLPKPSKDAQKAAPGS